MNFDIKLIEIEGNGIANKELFTIPYNDIIYLQKGPCGYTLKKLSASSVLRDMDNLMRGQNGSALMHYEFKSRWII